VVSQSEASKFLPLTTFNRKFGSDVSPVLGDSITWCGVYSAQKAVMTNWWARPAYMSSSGCSGRWCKRTGGSERRCGAGRRFWHSGWFL